MKKTFIVWGLTLIVGVCLAFVGINMLFSSFLVNNDLSVEEFYKTNSKCLNQLVLGLEDSQNGEQFLSTYNWDRIICPDNQRKAMKKSFRFDKSRGTLTVEFMVNGSAAGGHRALCYVSKGEGPKSIKSTSKDPGTEVVYSQTVYQIDQKWFVISYD